MDEDYEARGCTCWQGHPPCSFCTSMTEEEADLFAQGGSQAVRNHRNGWKPPEPVEVQLARHYACVEEYGEF